jgi:Ni/Co efflux regulator RcnB
MRKFILPLLLASVAASPAMAGPRDDNNHPGRADRAERAQVREERQQAREQRAVQTQRPEFSGPQHLNGNPGDGQPQFARPQYVGNPRQGFEGGASREVNVERAHGRFQGNTETYVAPGPRMVRNPYGGGAVQRIRDGDQPREVLEGRQHGPRVVTTDGQRQPDRTYPRVLRTRTPVVSQTPQPGTQPPLRVDNRRRNHTNWSTDWRRDNRYDWQNHRRHHRNWFHLGLYYDPFGWGYSPFQIGWRMWPSYYGSNYWINDPYQYRLPYAPPGYRWIRYYDDAILVDTWSGEVVDVLYNFFW